MASPKLFAFLTACGLAATQNLFAQQAVSSIEQSRLYDRTPTSLSAPVNADGMSLPDPDTSPSNDDSFGAQVLLKNQQRPVTFVISGGVSVIYTSNVALTNSGRRSDTFFIEDAAVGWSPHMGPNIEAQIYARGSSFQYVDTSALDFTSVGLGAGLAWSPPELRGISIFGRFDFTELISHAGDELLRDYEFTFGAQRAFIFGRSHALTIGTTLGAGISDPFAAQRDQVSGFLNYHLQIARHFDADFAYRYSYLFYNSGGREDQNHFLSLGLRYQLNDWAEATAILSLGFNRSNRETFNYDVVNAGAGVGMHVKF